MGESGGGGIIGGRYSCAGACPEEDVPEAWPLGGPPVVLSNRDPPLPGLVLSTPLDVIV